MNMRRNCRKNRWRSRSTPTHKPTYGPCYLLLSCYLLVDGLASSSASVVHIPHEVAVVGVLEGVDRLCIHNCRRETIPTVDRTLTEEKLPYVES